MPGGSGGDDSSGSSSSQSSGSTNPTGGGGDWELLIAGDWELSAGSEGYVCVVATMQRDFYIRALRPIAPLGTHHTVLTRAPFGADNTFPCDAATNGENMIYGSGVGTNTMDLPPGVAVKVAAGEALLLNLHLFNSDPSTISGTSGIEVLTMEPEDVAFEAEAVLAGTFSITLPPQSEGSAAGSCHIPNDVTLFGVGPHMHQLGTHMTVSVGGEVLHDEPYSFDDQRFYPLSPSYALHAGDSVTVACNYDNHTNDTVTWGDSSNQEMCFASLFVYPAGNFSFICAD